MKCLWAHLRWIRCSNIISISLTQLLHMISINFWPSVQGLLTKHLQCVTFPHNFLLCCLFSVTPFSPDACISTALHYIIYVVLANPDTKFLQGPVSISLILSLFAKQLSASGRSGSSNARTQSPFPPNHYRGITQMQLHSIKWPVPHEI